MSFASNAAFVLLAMSGLGCLIHLVRGRSTADRIVALDLMLVVVVSAIAVQAARGGTGAFLDVLVVAALLGFLGTVATARFIERRGTERP